MYVKLIESHKILDLFQKLNILKPTNDKQLVIRKLSFIRGSSITDCKYCQSSFKLDGVLLMKKYDGCDEDHNKYCAPQPIEHVIVRSYFARNSNQRIKNIDEINENIRLRNNFVLDEDNFSSDENKPIESMIIEFEFYKD